MKRIVFLLLIAVVVYSCGSDSNKHNVKIGKNEIVVDTFANGSPQLVRQYKEANGTRVAYYEKEYYEDGTILKEGELLDNKRNGKWKAYYRDGQLWNDGNYDLGVRNDTIRGYFENGNLKYEGMFEDGIKHGVWMFYDEDGKFKESKVYLLPGETFEDSIKVAE